MAFLTIYTPTYKRPTYLAQNQASVWAQTCQDVEQVVVVDEVGIGIEGMYEEIPGHADLIRGDYVYILQDDDVLADGQVVADLREFVVANKRPEVVMVRNLKRGNIYPAWRQEPICGLVDLGSYVIRGDVFHKNAHRFGRRYAGDYDFIRALWDDGYDFAWCDRLFAAAQALGLGRPESELTNEGTYQSSICRV